MEVKLRKCDACGGYRDPLGFSKIGNLEACTGCQIDQEINVNDLMKEVEKIFYRIKREAA